MDENQVGETGEALAAPAAVAAKPKVVGFDIGLSADSDTTYDIPLGFDSESGDVNAGITIFSKNSAAFREADRKLARVQLKKSSLRGRPLDFKKDADAEEFLDQRESTDIALATALTVGWFGLTNAGEEFAFTPVNVKMLYTSNAAIRGKVLAAAEEQANFLKR